MRPNSSSKHALAEVSVRAASLEEVNAVLGMYEWLFEPPGYTPRGWDRDRARESLADAIAGPDRTVLLAENSEGGLVGLATAYLELNSVRFGLRCWVEDLAVDPSRRGAGIGKALLDTAKAWAKERGATHLELDSAVARTDAHRFYEREGPVARGFSYTWAL
jgi:GNAT superfamily N-acetyltransferase